MVEKPAAPRRPSEVKVEAMELRAKIADAGNPARRSNCATGPTTSDGTPHMKRYEDWTLGEVMGLRCHNTMICDNRHYL